MSAMTNTACMNEEEYCLLSDLIQKEFGIQLKADKRLTLQTKISHRLRILGLKTYRAYYEYLVADTSMKELNILASHITNNETYFFREKSQLDVFAELLPEIKRMKGQKGDNSLKILSLASSSGEEAYSLNIILQESGLFLWGWDVKIIGMDLDRSAIDRARSACYTANSLRTVDGDAAFTQKYFIAEDRRYLLRKHLMNNVEFICGNLIDSASFEGLGNIDVIFCRNVLIYMSDAATDKIVSNIYNILSDTGYLFVGMSESLIQRTNLFVPEYRRGAIVYRKNVGV